MKNQELTVTLDNGTTLPLSEALELVAPVRPVETANELPADVDRALELLRVEDFRERVQRSFQVTEQRLEEVEAPFARSIAL